MNAGLTSYFLRLYQDFNWSFEHLSAKIAIRPSERLILRKHISNPTPVIFDVGANLGASVAFYRSLFPRARFFAFEPDPATFAQLLQRHGHNPLITLINAGVGASSERRKLYRNVISAMNSFHDTDPRTEWAHEARNLKQLPPEEVTLVRLDEVAAQHSVGRIDFLKSDTQGFEPEVLRGAEQLLKEKRIELLKLEVLPGQFYTRNVQLRELEEILSPFGYDLLTIAGIHYRPDGSLGYFDAFFAPRKHA